jgi:putative Mg2+ transporter-C (MgtC) family protein
MELREITYLAVALRIAAAVLLGGFIGLERGLKNRPAGLRTYMVVCVGACMIMLTNQYIFQVFGTGDPVRMGAQVVSGIGFLGAGTIIVTRRSQIKGLTTAAGLWASAGVGLALGIGFYEAAAMGAMAVFFVMTLLQRMDNRMHRKIRAIEVYFELDQQVCLGDFLRHARDTQLEVRDVQREPGDELGHRAYIATLKFPKRGYPDQLLEEPRKIPGVIFMEEI